MEFTQNTRKSIDSFPLEEDKKEHVRRALEIHMQRNPEAHMEVKAEKEDIMAGNFQDNSSSQQDNDVARGQDTYQLSVRACPCCLNFLKAKFNMSDKDARKFLGMDSAEYAKQNYSDNSGYSSTNDTGNYSSSKQQPYNQ